MYTTILLFCVMYSFACLGLEIITHNEAKKSNQEFKAIVDLYFANLPRIMLTLLQFIAMDSVASVYGPLVIEDGWLIIYFFGLILTVAVVLMNIVTAVIVNTALEVNNTDREAKRLQKVELRKVISEELGSMFRLFAADDGEDELDLEDAQAITLKELLESPAEAQSLLCQLTAADHVEDIFEEIDLDGNGELTLPEFCQGIQTIVCSEVPREVRKIQKGITLLAMNLQRVEGKLDSVLGIPSSPESGTDGSQPKKRGKLLRKKGDHAVTAQRFNKDPPKDQDFSEEKARNDQDGTWLPAAQQMLSELASMRTGAEQQLRACVADAETRLKNIAQEADLKTDAIKKAEKVDPSEVSEPKRNSILKKVGSPGSTKKRVSLQVADEEPSSEAPSNSPSKNASPPSRQPPKSRNVAGGSPLGRQRFGAAEGEEDMVKTESAVSRNGQRWGKKDAKP